MAPWTVACQAPLSMGFSSQEYWSGLPCPSPGDLPDPGREPWSPALQADSLLSGPPEKPRGSQLEVLKKHPERTANAADGNYPRQGNLTQSRTQRTGSDLKAFSPSRLGVAPLSHFQDTDGDSQPPSRVLESSQSKTQILTHGGSAESFMERNHSILQKRENRLEQREGTGWGQKQSP